MQTGAKTDEIQRVQNELVRAREDLARVKKEFEDFTYTVAHDLSGPLRHASIFAEMVLDNSDKVLDDKSKKFLSFIIDSAESGKKSLDLLKDHSKLSRHEQVIEENVNLADIVDAARISLSELIEKSSVIFEIDPLPIARGDRSQLTRLFQNLIKNSIIYRNEKYPPVVRIYSNASEDFWELIIEDNGIGISNELHESIFKIFYRGVDASDFIGDGMGLTVSKTIVEKHNGKIWVDAEYCEGTKIRFTIPRTI